MSLHKPGVGCFVLETILLSLLYVTASSVDYNTFATKFPNGFPPSWFGEDGSLDTTNALDTHPRLRVLDKDLERIRNFIKNDSIAAEYYKLIVESGERILKEPPVVRPTPRTTGILTTVEVALNRVYVTGLLYRLSSPPNNTWFERGWAELEACANFSDWNPHHFLDVAEMTHTIAIGYDWFYNELTDSQRLLLEKSLEEKGFQPALKAVKEFWNHSPDNWNNVCNGGLIIGCLAVFDKNSTCPSAKEVMDNAMKGLPFAMASYGPNGAWPEGVGYWAFATRYSVFAVTSLETVMGSDGGLGETPGFDKTALFVVHATAPSLQFFNYDDSGRYRLTNGPTDTPSLFYLARRFRVPSAAFLERLKLSSNKTAATEDLVHYTPMGTVEDVMKLPRCQVYPHQNIAMARSAWLDTNAAWLGVKAGLTHAGDPHGHLDVGSFVFEANGHRWAIDLGGDSYGLPEYFGPKRYTYYRLRNIGHNTLTFDNANQAENANAPLLSLVNCPGDGDFAQIDSNLTTAYTPNGVSIVQRRFHLDYTTKELQIYDRFVAGKAKNVTWAMHTFANISIDSGKSSAVLSYGSESMQVTTVKESTNCPQAIFSQEEIDLKPPQWPSTGVQKLMIQSPTSTCSSLTVSLMPLV